MAWREREVDRRQDVWEWEVCVCAREEIGQPSTLRLTRKAEALAMGSWTSLLSLE